MDVGGIETDESLSWLERMESSCDVGASESEQPEDMSSSACSCLWAPPPKQGGAL